MSQKKSGKQGHEVRIKSLIHSLAGTTKIIAEGLFVEAGTNALVVKARPTKREQCRCGICHKRASGYDSGRETRRWRCQDVGAEMTYIESSLPRVRCKEHGVVSAAVPWARHNPGSAKTLRKP
jgi:transposase